MSRKSFPATGWKNGKHSRTGVSYGLEISVEDRDEFFARSWKTVTLYLVNGKKQRTAIANVAKASFWDGTCRELINTEIRSWFFECGFAPWPNGNPPRFRMVSKGDREFEVRLAR